MDYLKTTAEKNRFQGILEGTIKSPEYVIWAVFHFVLLDSYSLNTTCASSFSSSDM
jgi:hypothetical protein